MLESDLDTCATKAESDPSKNIKGSQIVSLTNTVISFYHFRKLRMWQIFANSLFDLEIRGPAMNIRSDWSRIRSTSSSWPRVANISIIFSTQGRHLYCYFQCVMFTNIPRFTNSYTRFERLNLFFYH